MSMLDQWNDTEFEPLFVTKKDGTQMVIHPDGTEEVITEDDPRYNHWHNL